MPKLIHSILNSPWMIDTGYAGALAPKVAKLIQGKEVSFDQPVIESRTVEVGAETSNGGNPSTTESKTIAIVSIRGVITKDDQFCGPEGTESMNKTIKGFINNKAIDAIVLDMDTPGGQANFLDTLANTIKSSDKPIISYYNSLCASAGYYIASATDEIYASEPNDRVGSIGVVISFADMRGMFEKMGIKLHEVYATQSSEKNKLFSDALEGDYKALRAELLDPFAEQFIAAVKDKRTITNESVFKGATFNSDKAIELGLIDGVKTFDQALDRAAELATKNQQSNTNLNMKKNLLTVSTFLGLQAFESHKGQISLSEEDVAKIGAHLEANPGDAGKGGDEDPEANNNDKQIIELSKKLDSTLKTIEAQSKQLETFAQTLKDYGTSAGASGAQTKVGEEFNGKGIDSVDAPDFDYDAPKI